MTYQNPIQIVVSEFGNGGEYVKLPEAEGLERTGFAGMRCGRSRCWWIVVILLLCVCVVAVVAVFVVWIGPFLLNKVVTPILEWEITTFSRPVLGLLIFLSMTIFPFLLVPSTPSMWMAGIAFGYGYGFLLVISAASFGMSLPFIIGSLFHNRIRWWFEKWPEKAAIVRLAGEGNWFHQFRVITLLRLSPFPYTILNYATLATNIKYHPYIFGSLLGIIPDAFTTMYSGILIQNLAKASDGHESLSREQIIIDIMGFCIALSATIAITIYAKKTLQRLQAENEQEPLQ